MVCFTIKSALAVSSFICAGRGKCTLAGVALAIMGWIFSGNGF